MGHPCGGQYPLLPTTDTINPGNEIFVFGKRNMTHEISIVFNLPKIVGAPVSAIRIGPQQMSQQVPLGFQLLGRFSDRRNAFQAGKLLPSHKELTMLAGQFMWTCRHHAPAGSSQVFPAEFGEADQFITQLACPRLWARERIRYAGHFLGLSREFHPIRCAIFVDSQSAQRLWPD